MSARWRSTVAALAATAVFVTVQLLQLLILRDVPAARGHLRSFSDLALGAAFGVALSLWFNLRATRAALTAAERAQVVLDTQLALAAEVQRRLLPPPPDDSETPDVRWATKLKPAWAIGGDFYDFIPSTDGATLLLVGDVSGKGIPAALLQTSAHALFRTFAARVSNPAELLSLVSHEIFAENRGELYLTCLAVQVDRARGVVTYVNAGHPPGLVVGPSGQRLLDKGGVPVGLFPDARYQPETLCLEPGDIGLIVTDGITEAVEQDGVTPADTLAAAVSHVEEPITADRVCDAVMELALEGRGPRGVADWEDDKTVVVFEVEPAATAAAMPLTA